MKNYIYKVGITFLLLIIPLNSYYGFELRHTKKKRIKRHKTYKTIGVTSLVVVVFGVLIKLIFDNQKKSNELKLLNLKKEKMNTALNKEQ